MPYSIKRRTYRRKPATYKRKSYSKPKATPARRAYRRQNGAFAKGASMFRMSVGADPFPVTKYARLVFTGNYTLTAGDAGVLGPVNTFYLNSIHQPGGAGSHQPYGHDELALIYKHYKVNGCKIDLLFIDPSIDGMCVCARIVPPNVSAAITGQFPSFASESPMTVVKYVNNSGKQVTRLSQYVPMSRAIGITPLQFKSSTGLNYSALFGTNPTDMPTLLVAAANIRGYIDPTIVCQVRLTYFCQFYERQRLSTS